MVARRPIASSTACAPSSGEIERRHRLSRGEFLDRYYCAGRPVIITGMMDDWPALRKWSLDYFVREFGAREVEVQVGRSASDNYEADRDQFRRKMIFSEFIERVSSRRQEQRHLHHGQQQFRQQGRPARALGRHRADPGIPRWQRLFRMVSSGSARPGRSHRSTTI